ncbi:MULTISPECIES: helix-turn-helix domain-containing protein [unclassified Isoptericola]|uniref:helix-turn-helix domain-containing protein n=1 Tax=unclassified Isoptericola TaxID=2623355 RepID=UPI0036473539
MTQHDPTTDTPGPARTTVRYRGRHLPMVAVVVAATIATALAYSGMVLFGLEVAGMSPAEAYALAGFLEVSLVAVALMARNAALEGRPYGVLLTLTWILSGTSGMFAALHEIAVPDASMPYMVAFRFVPPLVAALMWHLALVGERHLVTGHTLDERRREHRVHQYVTALEVWRDARLDSTGNHAGMRKVRVAHRRQRAARDAALKLLTVEDFERRMQVWVERLEAAERHGNRLDLIGASSVERGVSRGSAGGSRAARSAAPAAPSLAALAATAQPVGVSGAAVTAPAQQPGQVPVVTRTDGGPADATFADEFEAALTGVIPTVEAGEPRAEGAADVTVEAWFDDPREDLGHDPAAGVTPHLTDERAADERAAEDVAADVVPRPADVEAEAGLPGTREPLPETGHTRRVEVFDLLRQSDPGLDPALGGALAERSAFLTSHGAPAEPAAPQEADALPASDRDRRIVELSGDGLTHREIAEQVEVSPSTVSRVVKRYAPA